jgi:hypothetical protein
VSGDMMRAVRTPSERMHREKAADFLQNKSLRCQLWRGMA